MTHERHNLAGLDGEVQMLEDGVLQEERKKDEGREREKREKET